MAPLSASPEAAAGPLDPAVSLRRAADALAVIDLLSVDPFGLGGVVLRARAGPVRDAWLKRLRAALAGLKERRLPAGAPMGRLVGGLDLSATLAAGRPVLEHGLLAQADGGVVTVAMAERLDTGAAMLICAALDSGCVRVARDGLSATDPARFAVIALDEGEDADEHVDAALADRLAFQVELDGLRVADFEDLDGGNDVRSANADSAAVRVDDAALEALCGATLALGIASSRAGTLAMKAARAAAALAGRAGVVEDDLVLAARLVLAPRATQVPTPPEAAEPEPPPPEQEDPSAPEDPPPDAMQTGPLEDRVLEAVAAALPPGLLAQHETRDAPSTPSRALGRAGARRRSLQRGRRIGVRPGDPRHGARLDLVETLRAAAPWQRLRATAGQAGGRIAVRTGDFRVARFEARRETTTFFVVDASGSAALHRLAEAKGAVELLLAESYARRDRVALIVFRGRAAEVVLPPTRALVRARRTLAGLPGGGGTPLAAGIELATREAITASRSGATPVVVFLTDGQANIARDGAPGRPQAEADALAAARVLRATGVNALMIDISPRGHAQSLAVASAMGARHVALPYADARHLSSTVQAALGNGPAPTVGM
jgi:magnesium chelatase subunit D